jgi:hypothetical protein
MRHLIVATAVLIAATSSHAQSQPAAASDSAAPALTKSIVIQAGDSPLVRAAKSAVASRQHPSNRRVLTLGRNTGRGRFAQATGPTEGPNIPPSTAYVPPKPDNSGANQANAQRAAEVQSRLKQLEQEEQVVGAEMDEPYGGDIEEDAVDKRLTDIAAERQKLQQEQQKPPSQE